MQINEAGLVALWSVTDAGVRGIYTSDGQTITPIVTTLGGFSTLGYAFDLNNAGELAFSGTPPAGASGVWLADGATVEPVVLPGDTLFGSSVQSAVVNSFCLNDAGQVAFTFLMVDGRQGIALATPVPEPGSAALLAAAGAALLVRQRRRVV